MRAVTNTNIIVDDFGYCKSFPKNTFVHFLTHFHADHWDGLTPLWDYSPIYCSEITAALILNKFPKLDKLIVRCEYYKEYSIFVGHGDLVIKFWVFDAKHIPGSSMFLFEGYMGRILVTGDFRYEFSMVLENKILFPPEIREKMASESQNCSKKSLSDNESWVESQSGLSIPVDEVIFDNTYCNQMFDFGTETEIFKKVVAIIDQHRGKKVLITLSALGKNRILYKLSQYYQTLICVKESKLKQVQAAGGYTHIFTLNPQQCFIEVISKNHRKQRVEQEKRTGEKFICIHTDFLMVQHQAPDGINFMVPYSVHSNFKQMSTFIRMIKPATLYKLVIPFQTFKERRFNKVINNRLKLSLYLDRYQKMKKSKSGYSSLMMKYTDITRLSKEYLKWMYPETQEELMRVLRIGNPDHSLRKRALVFEERVEQYNRETKKSLSDIAGELKATHKNKSLVQMMNREEKEEKEKEEKFERLFKDIFSGDESTQIQEELDS